MADECHSESTGKCDDLLAMVHDLFPRWLMNVSLSLQVNVMICWQWAMIYL